MNPQPYRAYLCGQTASILLQVIFRLLRPKIPSLERGLGVVQALVEGVLVIEHHHTKPFIPNPC